MMIVRRIRADALHLVKPLADEELVAEETVLRIGTFGMQLDFRPLPRPEWRSFPPAAPVDPVFLVNHESCALYGAFEDEAYIGYAAVTIHPQGWADVIDLRVDASFRRRSAGRMLLEKCAAFAAKRNLHGLRVVCTDQNPGMCHLLQHEGFSLCGFDTMALTQSPEERLKPKSRRPALLIFYRLNQK